MLWALQSCSPHWDTRYLWFGFERKAFLSPIILVINVYLWKKTNLDARNNLYSFCSGHYNHVLLIGDTRYLFFGFARKAFLSTIFIVINAHLRNKTNLDTQNNLCSFCYWHYNHVLHNRIHDIDALDLLEKLFFHHCPCN